MLYELFEICGTSKYPVGVVDENNRIIGVIVRGAVLGALAGQPLAKEEVHKDDPQDSSR